MAENERSSRCLSFLLERFSMAQKNFHFYLFFPTCLTTDSSSDDAGMMECCNDTKERKLSKNDILNAPYTLNFSHTDTAECKYHCHASLTIEKEFSFLLSNHSTECPLSYLPRPLR